MFRRSLFLWMVFAAAQFEERDVITWRTMLGCLPARRKTHVSHARVRVRPGEIVEE